MQCDLATMDSGFDHSSPFTSQHHYIGTPPATPTLDPCAAVRCPPGHVCHNGRCISSSTSPQLPTPITTTGRPTRPPVTFDPRCAAVDCAPGFHCVHGRCLLQPTRADPCALVDCSSHQYCENGRCINHTCDTYRCRSDQECLMTTVGCNEAGKECYERPECRDAQYGIGDSLF